MSTNPSSLLRAKYDFNSEMLDIVISGTSAIDSVTAFQVKDAEEADRFIRSYGYDLDNPIEKAEILGNFHEALNFIRKNFLYPENAEGIKLEIPRKIIEITDIRDLLLMVSLRTDDHGTDAQNNLLQQWACSILKVMHTIAHIDKDVRTPYFADIQKQIFDRFYKLIHRDPEGDLFLGERFKDPLRIHLDAFETKPKKSRTSMILKLLHKPGNVAEDIFDRVGIRFITQDSVDCLRVIKFLKDKMIIMPPNIKPSRSRNTLIQVETFRTQLADFLAQTERGEISEQQFKTRLEETIRQPSSESENPHTSKHYKALQFTCRQLIKLQNPLYHDLKGLKNLVKSSQIPEDLFKAIERIDLKYTQREIRFFYPYEVQIVDKQSSEENEKGKSAHSEYKRAQLQTAVKRVMGNLVNVVRQ
jgi:uncharacterized protein (TIGR04562 family)